MPKKLINLPKITKPAQQWLDLSDLKFCSFQYMHAFLASPLGFLCLQATERKIMSYFGGGDNFSVNNLKNAEVSLRWSLVFLIGLHLVKPSLWVDFPLQVWRKTQF